MRTTRTFVTLDVSGPAWQEIHDKLVAAGYQHAIIEDDGKKVIDMHGIGLTHEE